jgi:hypothetical protein
MGRRGGCRVRGARWLVMVVNSRFSLYKDDVRRVRMGGGLDGERRQDMSVGREIEEWRETVRGEFSLLVGVRL